MSNNIFCLSRFGKLVKSDLVARKATIFIAAITIIGVLLFYNLISPYNIVTVNKYPIGFIFLLFIGGVLISSNGFKNMHDKQSSYFYLTLPCSNFEKFLSRMLLTSIIYAVSILVLYTLFYWILGILSFIFFHQSHFIVTPFTTYTWYMIWLYMIIQSVFLLGSIYFKKLSLIKTVLVASCIGIIFMLVLFIISKIFLAGLFAEGPVFVPHMVSAGAEAEHIFSFIFWILLAPFCWVVTYFRLKEIEV